ncbi:putative m7g trna methyltransferase [Phaeomoniella chlamydospora]|uniref:tRNA (guanine-N(7)-)-methyltransferase n=1 Tax=Phaeomoniella chlamydospora TaxID=158046 RepID=A0A0G2EUC1_PHACM|nr:putative m7g trna methyltransferase [Phaeomoniella chlamydospora]
MTGPPNKRQKREEYQKAHEAALNKAAATAAVGKGYSADNGKVDGGNAGSGENDAKTTITKIQLPKKKFYRQRAHANPFSDHALVYPESPDQLDWTSHFPYFANEPQKHPRETLVPDIADIGCGFGGLLVALSPVFPETLMLGMELRNQVLTYVTSRISALRSQNLPTSPLDTPPPYSNISALRTNSMKFLPQYFPRAALSKIFLCFPDPHFKQRKHKARIVSRSLCAEYAYVLKRGTGVVYTITDVEELSHWMASCFNGPRKQKVSQTEGSDQQSQEQPTPEEEVVDDGDEAGDATGPGVEELFEEILGEELANDPCVRIMSEETEEAKKVTRNGGKKFIRVWRRREDPEWQ